MGNFYAPDPNLGPVKVIAFSGRETDAPYGIWGALAEQMGKKELFQPTFRSFRRQKKGIFQKQLGLARSRLIRVFPRHFFAEYGFTTRYLNKAKSCFMFSHTNSASVNGRKRQFQG